jgi:predicted dehydrogenase
LAKSIHHYFFTFEEKLTMEKIRWGIIGCGNVTEIKSGPALQNAENSELVAVMRRNADLAKDYAERHHVARWYSDAAALIADPEVDAIYVATPPWNHKEFALLAAQAGKPVYVEKPMAMNYKECLEMANACEEAGVPLFVAYYRRALPRFLMIKKCIDENAIGQIRFVNITFHQRPAENDLKGIENWRVQPGIPGGYFSDLACHTLDILQFFFGIIISAQGQASNQGNLYQNDDIVSGSFLFANGAHGTGTWCFSAFDNLDRTEIVGEKGKITFATFGNEPLVLETNSGIQTFPAENPLHIQQPLIQTIVDELLGKGKCPSTGRTAARTSWAMDRILS